MFRDTRTHLLAIGLLGLTVLSSPALAQQTESDLLATLKDADAPIFDKTIACKQLAIVGTEAAVPVLAGLLQDEGLSHYARYALEPIPSPKVDEALLAAMATLKGRELIGVINSLANRGKPAAIGPLSKMLDDTDRTVATAAAHSIARLGTPQACEILGTAMPAEFAAAGLVCGKTLARQGHAVEAVVILEQVNEMKDAPKHVRLAAMIQAVQLQQRDGVEMLAAALASDDKQTFNAGLRAARLLTPADASQAVRDAAKDAAPSRTALLITLLGDLGDPASLSAVVEAAGSDDATVRLAAIEALATLGGAAHVPLLMDAAVDKSESISSRGLKTLAALAGDDVDRAVLDLLNDKSSQATVIRLIGQRRITAAAPKLLALLDGPHRLDVIAALGETVSLGDLDVLCKILRSNSEELRLAARNAIHAACNRMPDRDATAARLAIFLNGASEETVEFLMEELRLIGGPKALATVALAAKGRSATQKEYATQALGGWLDTSAAPVLLDLAKAEGTGKYGIRGMRGYIRLIRQFSMPERQRAEMCRTALQTARRDAEKKLVLEVLQRYPDVDSLKIAVAAAKDPALKIEAAATALIIAQQIGGKSGDVKTLLAQVGQDPVKIEIVKAEYGAGVKMKDVTATLRRHARDLPLIVLPSPKYNTAFGGDPASGSVKTLKIQYKIDGKPGEVVLPENATILLPTPK
ncbi:MAG: HEAT repeat domain-containing protein [Candidatus Nealsonbacteria bacterium]|nr:HEAT repeat domain-containing protein [Candidatus Nealsonbacteria bacterium]